MTILKNLNVSLNSGKLFLTGELENKEFELKIPVDVVSIDSKPYIIPKDTPTIGPVDIDSLGAKVEHDMKPSVEYVRLATGLYVPVKYVDEDVMKKLKELDDEFMAVKFVHDTEGLSGYDSYDEFSDLYLRQDEIRFEQAKLIIEELQRKGFAFIYGSGEFGVEVTGPDGRKGYAVRFCGNFKHLVTMGKWAPVGVAALIYYKNSESDVQFKKRRLNVPIRGRVSVCNLRKKSEYEFFCVSGPKIPIRLERPLLNHTYIVSYLKFDDAYYQIALSYSPIHQGGQTTTKRQFASVSQGVYKAYNYELGKCTCGVNYEDVRETIWNVDVISVDGRLKIVNKKMTFPLEDVDDPKNVVVYDKPSVEYVGLPTGLYVPKGYVDEDVMKKLMSVPDKKEQAKIIVEELKKKGFKFVRYGEEEPSEMDTIEVRGPDGEPGFYINRQYRGKWSLIGKAYLIYLSTSFNNFSTNRVVPHGSGGSQ